MMNASQKLAMEKMAGVYNENDPYQMNTYNKYLRNILAGVDTYWLSQPLRTAVQTRHTLTAAGGTDKFRYNLGLNAGFMPGVMKGSQNDTKGITFSMSYRKDKFTVGADINLSETNGKNSPYGSFSSYTQANPYYPMKNADNQNTPYQITHTKLFKTSFTESNLSDKRNVGNPQKIREF